MNKLKIIKNELAFLEYDKPNATYDDLKICLRELVESEFEASTGINDDEYHERLETVYDVYDDQETLLKELIAKEALRPAQLKYLNDCLRYFEAVKSRLKGQPEKLLALHDELNDNQTITNQNKTADEYSPVTIEELCNTYIKEKEPRWGETSKLSNQGKKLVFIEIFDYLKIADVNSATRDNFLTIRDIVCQYPANKQQKFKDEPLNKIIDKKEYKTISHATVQHYLTFLNAVMSRAKKTGRIKIDLSFDLKTRDPEHKADKRDAFTCSEAKTIIDYCQQAYNKSQEAWQLYVPYLALITGARQNEICQLQVKNIITTESGITYIDINDIGHDTKRLKNTASKRKVPLIDGAFGFPLNSFLEYVKTRDNQDSFIFSLPYKNKAGYGDKVSKWFNRTLLKAASLKREKLNFHSFRHTLTTLLTHGDISLQVTDQITGHSPKSISHGVYGKEIPIEKIHATLSKIFQEIE